MSQSMLEDIASPQTYTDPAVLHERYARLRQSAPVSRCEHPAYRPFWALVSHQDISEVSKQNELFINAPRLTLVP